MLQEIILKKLWTINQIFLKKNKIVWGEWFSPAKALILHFALFSSFSNLKIN